jgi:hypothetical protein
MSPLYTEQCNKKTNIYYPFPQSPEKIYSPDEEVVPSEKPSGIPDGLLVEYILDFLERHPASPMTKTPPAKRSRAC